MSYKNCDDSIKAVYVISCTATGNQYVGETLNVDNRWEQHLEDLRNNKHHSKFMQKEFNEYGESKFIFQILIRIPQDTPRRYDKASLLYWEDLHIKAFNTITDGYNSQDTMQLVLDEKKGLYGNTPELGDSAIMKHVIEESNKNGGFFLMGEPAKFKTPIYEDTKEVREKREPLKAHKRWWLYTYTMSFCEDMRDTMDFKTFKRNLLRFPTAIDKVMTDTEQLSKYEIADRLEDYFEKEKLKKQKEKEKRDKRNSSYSSK